MKGTGAEDIMQADKPVGEYKFFCYKLLQLLKFDPIQLPRILGKNLIVFRGESDEAHVFDAYCAHMGAHLGVGGTVLPGDCLQCPFHGWIFDGKTGQCVQIPSC